MNKDKLQTYDIGTDDDLNAQEKETTLTIPNDKDGVVIYSDVATMIKWVLSVEESKIVDHRLKNGEIVGVKARIPKGIIKLQGSARKSNAHSQMVSYGDEL
jgi:hypothetical protein